MPGGSSEESGLRLMDRSPDEVRETVKKNVRRGIAGLAGALEGLNEEVEQDHLPEKTEEAIHNVGETARKLFESTREESRHTREAMRSKKE